VYFTFFFQYILLVVVSVVVITNCPERLFSKMTGYVLSGTLNPADSVADSVDRVVGNHSVSCARS